MVGFTGFDVGKGDEVDKGWFEYCCFGFFFFELCYLNCLDMNSLFSAILVLPTYFVYSLPVLREDEVHPKNYFVFPGEIVFYSC